MKLDLSPEHVNQILGLLGKAPYENVYQLVNEIQIQAQQQMDAEAQQTEQTELKE